MGNLMPSSSTVASGTLGVAVAVLVAWVLQQFVGVEMPGEVQAALGAIVSTVIGFFFTGGKNADVSQPPVG